MNRVSVAVVALGMMIAFSAGALYNQESTITHENMTGTANIVAAAQNSNTGAVGKVEVEAVKGDGDNLIETDPFVQADTQFSASKARKIAEEYTGKNLGNYDLIYKIEMDSTVVGGPSAGAAMTLATIASVTDKKVRNKMAITGTITESGRIGKVGEIPVKATAAGQNNIENLYVPEGQSTKVNYQPVLEEERRGLLVYKDVEYQRQVFNISEYTEKNFDTETSEVGNIYQAADKMLK